MYKKLTRYMNVEIGTRPHSLIYRNTKFGFSLQCILCILMTHEQQIVFKKPGKSPDIQPDQRTLSERISDGMRTLLVAQQQVTTQPAGGFDPDYLEELSSVYGVESAGE
jgi:hypothetical protein